MGLPGSGKSMWAERILGDHRHVSSDAIREEITGDVNDMSQNEAVFGLYHHRIKSALLFGDDVVADATNLLPTARDDLRRIAALTNADAVHLIVFTNLGQAVARNSRRERVVPGDVMIRFTEQYEKARRDILFEPYTSVTHIELTR
jgi:predicted kinase